MLVTSMSCDLVDKPGLAEEVTRLQVKTCFTAFMPYLWQKSYRSNDMILPVSDLPAVECTHWQASDKFVPVLVMFMVVADMKSYSGLICINGYAT